MSRKLEGELRAEAREIARGDAHVGRMGGGIHGIDGGPVDGEHLAGFGCDIKE